MASSRRPDRTPSIGWLIAAGVAGGVLAARAALRARRLYDLRGKVVLITGGSRGLGLVLARAFAYAGARIAVCARDAGEIERARGDLAARGIEVFGVSCDLTERVGVERLVREVRAHYGRIDVLVNNAGLIQVGPMETMTPADYEEALRIHFWAPLYTMLAVLPEMRRRRSGRIVNISSVGGKISMPHLLPYCSSKFALTGLSQGMRAALLQDNVFVTTVCPGLLRTGSPRNAFFKGYHRAEYTWFSISDSLPILSMGAPRAARQIVAACRRGDAELVLPTMAKVWVTAHALFPGLVTDLLGSLERTLPQPGGIGSAREPGARSSSALSPSPLTLLGDSAAVRNNEI
ncbi:MAG TPA: SDR family oxidoreductase [Gemmatimonadaceae bacterium]|nr:SDR family oxidoreductase [Gemmatimonadaceae bacterium]